MVPERGAGAGVARRGALPLSKPAPFFTVVVPTLGNPAKLAPLLDALQAQTLPSTRAEIIVAFDGCPIAQALRTHIEGMGAHAVTIPERRGPGAARNAAAKTARGEWLAFTEDDCIPAPDWLELAAARIYGGPPVDVLEGETVTPRGSAVRRRDRSLPNYLPTNLFVRRTMFDLVGGYSEQFFDASRRIYFREDSDFGFRLEETGANVAFYPAARVTHPAEHPHPLDPLRWARRYEMDALLERRHPARFRERLEVTRIGPLRFRRVVLRASFGFVLAILASAATLLWAERGLAMIFLAIAAVALLPVWGKWSFHPARLPVALLVPWILVISYLRGVARVRALARSHPVDSSPG